MALSNGIQITRGLQTWNFQNAYVERQMDNAAYTTAHPDDTLVLAGPPRFASVDQAANTESENSVMAIGMVQGFTVNQARPTQPLMALGSGRQYFVSGKAQGSFSIGRLFSNGRNVLRVLYHSIVANGGVEVSEFDDSPVARNTRDQFYSNLDSELYYIPFGLMAIFRSKRHDLIGSFYLELANITSYSIGSNAGQTMTMENVTGLFDRKLPFVPTDIARAGSDTLGQTVDRRSLDAIIGFTSDAGQDGSELSETIG